MSHIVRRRYGTVAVRHSEFVLYSAKKNKFPSFYIFLIFFCLYYVSKLNCRQKSIQKYSLAAAV